MELKGIDVSHHQGVINWEKVKNDGIKFAMIRMGFGSDKTRNDDAYFNYNVKECEKYNIKWGAYLYSYALNVDDVKSEVSHARRLLKGKNPDFPIAFDMEDADKYKQKNGMPNKSTLVDICWYFLNELEKDGHYVSLYANKYWLDNKLNSKRLDRFDKWLAQWTNKPTYDKQFLMWQYTSTGKVNGIKGNVDKNIAYTDFNFNGKNEKIISYTVRAFDTLTKIANKYNTSIDDIMKRNPHIYDKNLIYVGETLKIKKG